MAVPLVFEHGSAETAFEVAVGAWLVFEVVMATRQFWRARRLPGGDPSAYVLSAAIFASVYVSVRLGRDGPLQWPGGHLWPVIVGIALIAIGVGLRAWSIATLGRFFQYHIEVQVGHRVVSDGPYRWVRHPSYSGIALVIAGIAVASGDVLSLAVAAVLTATGLAVRIRLEERQLEQALGAEYERFEAGRKRIVPGVW